MPTLDWDDVWFWAQPIPQYKTQLWKCFGQNKFAKLVATNFWLCANHWTTTRNCGILSQEIPSTCGQLSHLKPADCIMLLVDWHDIWFQSAFTKQPFGRQNITSCYKRWVNISFGTCGQLSDLKHADCRLHNGCWLRWLLISCTRCRWIPRRITTASSEKTILQLNYIGIGFVFGCKCCGCGILQSSESFTKHGFG